MKEMNALEWNSILDIVDKSIDKMVVWC